MLSTLKAVFTGRLRSFSFSSPIRAGYRSLPHAHRRHPTRRTDSSSGQWRQCAKLFPPHCCPFNAAVIDEDHERSPAFQRIVNRLGQFRLLSTASTWSFSSHACMARSMALVVTSLAGHLFVPAGDLPSDYPSRSRTVARYVPALLWQTGDACPRAGRRTSSYMRPARRFRDPARFRKSRMLNPA